jgi:hypothetical protein
MKVSLGVHSGVREEGSPHFLVFCVRRVVGWGVFSLPLGRPSRAKGVIFRGLRD